MSPEQMEGREVTVRSDIYSMGLVLYELFSGKPGFEGGSLPDIARSRATDPPSLSTVVPGLDPAVGRIVARCQPTDPAARPSSAAAIAAALPGGYPLAAALAAGETPSPEMVAESGPSSGLRPGAAVALVVVAVIALVGVCGSVELHSAGQPGGARFSLPVLANKASDVIRAAGWGEATQDRVFEWVPNVPYYEHWSATSQAPIDGALSTGRVPPPALRLPRKPGTAGEDKPGHCWRMDERPPAVGGRNGGGAARRRWSPPRLPGDP